MQPFKVLLVDDCDFMLFVAREAMRMSNIELTCISNPKSAVEAIERLSPELIILDVQMPAMNGFEVAEAIRATPSISDSTILFLTVSPTDENKKRAEALGAVGFLGKPTGLKDLGEQVEEFASGGRIKKQCNSVERQCIQLARDIKTIVQ